MGVGIAGVFLVGYSAAVVSEGSADACWRRLCVRLVGIGVIR
jgi:hypothetical protein